MHKTFTTHFFEGNRKRLRELTNSEAPIILTANGLLQRSGDTTFPFTQDKSFWYLSGIKEPDIILIMSSREEFLIIPGRSASRETFDGSIDRAQLTKISGISKIYDEQEGWKKLTALINRSKTAATLAAAPSFIDSYGMYTNPARRRLVARIQKIKPSIEIHDLRETLAGMRMVKQDVEIDAIRKAIKITSDGLSLVTLHTNLKNYKHEYEIEADLSRAFRRTGADGHAFAPIVASGKRSCTLHHVENNGGIQAGEMIVLDVGAEVDYYAADITRTVMAAHPTERQLEVYEAVKDAQKYALSLLKPGILLKEYESQVEEYIGLKLVDLGLIREINRQAVREYYPHAASHFLGLDVHDVGDYSRPLELNVVLTCEPGIYIPAEGIGVRIEDDVLITENGNEVLSKDVPTVLYANA